MDNSVVVNSLVENTLNTEGMLMSWDGLKSTGDSFATETRWLDGERKKFVRVVYSSLYPIP